jgi:plasmid stability protein
MAPKWSRIGAAHMPVNLSIKNAPDEIVRRLRERASRHHRSLQGELLAILEASVRLEEQLSTENLLAEVQRLGLRTPSESAAMIRIDRDAR